jgi:hypothetical protein
VGSVANPSEAGAGHDLLLPQQRKGMPVQIKAESIEANLGNNGITLRIADNDGKSVGRLQIGRAKLRWWKGRASTNYKDVPMDKFLDWLDSQ